MVKTRQTDDPVYHRRPSPNEVQRNGNNQNRQNAPRQSSAKTTAVSSDSNQQLIKMASSDAPHEKRHGPKQKKRSSKQNREPRDFTVEELQGHKERIINTRLNKELFQNMKDSILSLNTLTNGLTEQVALVREQQRNAKNLWNDLENQFLRFNIGLQDDRGADSTQVRSVTPSKLVLPHIDSAVVNDVSRQNSLPSVFRDTHSPTQKESEVFNAAKTNHIKKVAKKRSKESSKNIKDMFPMVTQDLGMPHLQLISKAMDDVPKKSSLCTDKEARERIAKRLLALRAFQEKFIIEPNKGSSTRAEKYESDDITSEIRDSHPHHRQKDLNKKLN